MSNLFFVGLGAPNKKLLQNRSNGLCWASRGCYDNQQTCLTSKGPALEEDDGFCYETCELHVFLHYLFSKLLTVTNYSLPIVHLCSSLALTPVATSLSAVVSVWCAVLTSAEVYGNHREAYSSVATRRSELCCAILTTVAISSIKRGIKISALPTL